MNRSTHMMTAAIAFDELTQSGPKIVEDIIGLLSHHPERAPFDVMAGGKLGTERAHRLFMGMARWPDDIRGGGFDHPTWHGMARPLIDERNPPAHPPRAAVVYDGFEAFALNIRVAGNSRASAGERAVALCWILHLVGDVHQPLHTAELYSQAFPDGDEFGGKHLLLDPQSGQVVNLHWYWDFLVSRQLDPDAVLSKALELKQRFPRELFTRELADSGSPSEGFAAWAAESYAIAKDVAYGAHMPRATSAEDATLPDHAYLEASLAAAEKHFTLAGYRLATVLRSIFN